MESNDKIKSNFSTLTYLIYLPNYYLGQKKRQNNNLSAEQQPAISRSRDSSRDDIFDEEKTNKSYAF